VREAGPAILLFKPGYHYAAYANGSSAEAPTHMTSRWNGKDLQVKRISSSMQEASAVTTATHVHVDYLIEHNQGSKAMKFICAVANEGDKLKRNDPNFLGITSTHVTAHGMQCHRGKPE
jgi:hypothetical protein